jgi:hypothetical protein
MLGVSLVVMLIVTSIINAADPSFPIPGMLISLLLLGMLLYTWHLVYNTPEWLKEQLEVIRSWLRDNI